MLRDKDIREPLFGFLEEMYGKIRILEEKQIGNPERISSWSCRSWPISRN